MLDGSHYYPDVLVQVAGRKKGNGILLVEVKGEHLINSLKNPDKAAACHRLYRQPLMAMKEASGRWMTLRLNEKNGKNESDAVFRIGAMTEY
jgi:type III restriction enzyme